MDPFTASTVGLGAKIGGSILGGLFGSGVNEAQRQASLERARRQNLQNLQVEGTSRASAAASGLDLGGGSAAPPSSMASYLALMSQEFRKQNQWNIDQANRGADISGDANLLNTFSGIGGALFNYGKQNNWWQSAVGVSP
jgi:hypothetical protein